MQPDAMTRIKRAQERLAAGEITLLEYQQIVKEARRTTMLEPPAPSHTRREA